MFDSTAVAPIKTTEYSDFIREAFINPIRSVSVVDDEYPTIDILLERQSNYLANGKQINKSDSDAIDKEELSNLIPIVELCRAPERNWMLDVYDGKPLGDDEGQVKFAQRLTHSDLLILDYHLEGEHDGPGLRALSIMKQLAGVEHFNLVVVHTKGYQSAVGNLDPVLRDIVATLQKNPDFKVISEVLVQRQIEGQLDDWNDDHEGIREKLLQSINDIDVLSILRDYGETDRKSCLTSKYVNTFRGLFQQKPEGSSLNENLLFWWVLSHKYIDICNRFPEGVEDRVKWGKSGDVNWVRTDKLFVTIVGKDVAAEELPERLVTALVEWNPHPHKLLMSKLRHEVDEKGISIAADIVAKHYIQAHWLENLLSAEVDELQTKACDVIGKHWEELASRTIGSLSDFARNMILCLKDTIGVQGAKDKFIGEDVLNDQKNVLAYANVFSCSKPVSGFHLTTGHVVEVLEGETTQYWLCMSPACDLVPNQKDYKLGSHIPVKLVRLYDARAAFESADDNLALERALEVANSNEILFLNVPVGIKAFCFTPYYGRGNPKWEQFYAANNGLFQADKKVSLKRVKSGSEDALEIRTCDAEVVTQLRSEYAFNLLQKLGVSLSRIGLDFAHYKKEDAPVVVDAG